MTQEAPRTGTDLRETMYTMGRRARTACRELGELTASDRSRGLRSIAAAIRANAATILQANELDMAAARARNLSGPMLDRLALDEARLEAVARGADMVAGLPDPIGRETARWTRPNGLDFARVSVPLGVIGIIFESRPNVTVDAGILCLRSGNAAILRCGSESIRTSRALADAMRGGLKNEELPVDAIQLVPLVDREAVGLLLGGLDGNLDVIIPRGGRSLVQRVQDEARVPVIGHLEGLCHTYIHSGADPGKAVEITVNAKMRRTGICGATETLLIDAAVAPVLLPPVASVLQAAGCRLRGDATACSLVDSIDPATDEDWATEYLDAILSIAVVPDLAGALAHIRRWSSGHTEAIITEDCEAAETFLSRVDSAIVLHNASTQFADGAEFGFGAEIGIATGRIHARGPVGADQLTSYKYVVRGNGQVRP